MYAHRLWGRFEGASAVTSPSLSADHLSTPIMSSADLLRANRAFAEDKVLSLANNYVATSLPTNSAAYPCGKIPNFKFAAVRVQAVPYHHAAE